MTERFDRQSFLGAESTALLESLRVGIVGLGGGGSHIVQQLAHLGVGDYVLADPDAIDDSNLNRLVGGRTSDVKSKTLKVSIAARQIRSLMPSAKIVEVPRAWQMAAELLRDRDVIFGCVDSFGERQQLEQSARRFLVPYLDIGMDVFRDDGGHSIVGQVALSLPGYPCLQCMGVVRQDTLTQEGQRYGSAGGKPQVVWPNGVLASTAVGIAMRLVCAWYDATDEVLLFEYDGNKNTLTPSPILLHLARSCPHYSDVNSVGDPWFSVGSVKQ